MAAPTRPDLPRVVIAGQTPPPVLGQYVATADLVERLAGSGRFRVEHLPFRFARAADDLRVARIGKFAELARIIGRTVRLRLRGGIDFLVYPVGGPSAVVALRDTVLLPPLMVLSRRTVLLFHSGGHAEAWSAGSVWQRAATAVYRRAVAGIVLTEFGRRDPEALGIGRVFVAPHELADRREPDLISRGTGPPRILYLGSIDSQKGVPDLIEAVSRLDEDFTLVLVGESHPSYPESKVSEDIERLTLDGQVERTGVLTGHRKAEELGRADLLVFSSTHPGETFGLVLVEAMMWALPMIAVDWRGAVDVVGDVPRELLVDADPPLSDSLERGLRFAFDNRLRWEEWGARNRERYEERYRPGASTAFEDALEALL
ncbi:MAG: glycosyltransferase family 4 protein [Acidimicrobiia bacterium]